MNFPSLLNSQITLLCMNCAINCLELCSKSSPKISRHNLQSKNLLDKINKKFQKLPSTYYQQSLKRNLHKIVFNCKVLSCSSCHEKRIKEIKFLFLICHEKTPEASSPYEIWIISQKHIFLFPLNVAAEQPFHGIIKLLNWSPSCNLQIIVNTEKSCFFEREKTSLFR